MRSWALLAVLVVLAVAPAAAQGDGVIASGTYQAVPLLAREGSGYNIRVMSDVPVDVVLVNGTDDEYVAGTGGTQRIVERLNVTSVDVAGDFPSPGRWTLIIDNSDRPAGGANGTMNATVDTEVVMRHRVNLTGTGSTWPTPLNEQPGSNDPWPVLMLTAPFWDLGFVGLGGMALWFLILAAILARGYRAGWDKLGVLVTGTTLLVAAWSLIPGRGPIVQVGLPLLVSGGIAWLATRATPDGLQRARLAFLAGGLGAILGVALGHLLQAIWSNPGTLLVGADRFDDAVFVIPLAAAGLAFLISAIAAFVEASREEEFVAVPESPGLGQSFTVQCLRCQTPITVDRSMKRYRVATDRYEFACPNCHAWMEWSEPKPDGAAAA